MLTPPSPAGCNRARKWGKGGCHVPKARWVKMPGSGPWLFSTESARGGWQTDRHTWSIHYMMIIISITTTTGATYNLNGRIQKTTGCVPHFFTLKCTHTSYDITHSMSVSCKCSARNHFKVSCNVYKIYKSWTALPTQWHSITIMNSFL